jgi:iron complex transport system ATP-binding protein
MSLFLFRERMQALPCGGAGVNMPQHVENTAHRTGIELQQLSAGYRHNTIVHDICPLFRKAK